MFTDKKLTLPAPAEALKGRAERMPVPPKHHVLVIGHSDDLDPVPAR